VLTYKRDSGTRPFNLEGKVSFISSVAICAKEPNKETQIVQIQRSAEVQHVGISSPIAAPCFARAVPSSPVQMKCPFQPWITELWFAFGSKIDNLENRVRDMPLVMTVWREHRKGSVGMRYKEIEKERK